LTGIGASNGLLHQYFPGHADLRHLDQDALDIIAER